MTRPSVIFQPDLRARTAAGFGALADLLAVTLGPAHGLVLSQHTGAPEVLSDAATIARRFLALPDPAESSGAMLLRNLVWRVHETAGDGCATAAVLARALLSAASAPLAAGADPVALCNGMRQATDAAIDELRALARPPCCEAELAHVAETATGDARLSALLAEIFDILGPDAAVEVEGYVAPYLEREYLHGGAWRARLASPFLAGTADQRSAILRDAHVALFDGPVERAADVLPLLELAAGGRLLLVAATIAGEALGALVANHRRGALQVIAAELRSFGDAAREDLADLAALTGARARAQAAGDRLAQIGAADLGRARFARAGAEALLVSGGRGAPGRGELIAALRARAAQEPAHTAAAALRRRIARLAGSCAILKVGAATESERAILRRRAEGGVLAVSGALRHGLLPGGGAAYLACVPALGRLPLCGDAATGRDIVARALAAPLLRIAHNAGVESPQLVLAEVQRRGPGHGYDAMRGMVIEMRAAGILDSAHVQVEALRAASSGARMALSTEALVLKRRPELSMTP